MKVFAVSDCHVECAQNKRWLQGLPTFGPDTALIVAGDLGVTLTQVRWALLLFKQRFEHVFFCWGNHECWHAPEPAGADAGENAAEYDPQEPESPLPARFRNYANSLEKLRVLEAAVRVYRFSHVAAKGGRGVDRSRLLVVPLLLGSRTLSRPACKLAARHTTIYCVGPCGRPDIVQMA